ncbi:DUF1775 domain-containing protein [Streptomyces chartreusis]|uniref:DUF1775 domain-containing protein n=1 Tax=Streptomyces chartreusis TaxID=1969 RepID=UPI0036957C46
MSHRTRWRPATFITAAASAVGAVFLLGGPATAHVRVIGEARPGQPATLQFRVPSELADATTVRVAVAIPAGLAVITVPPVDGWTEKTTVASSGGATQLVWTAQSGHEIKPDDHENFKVRVGPLPDQRSLSFDTEQTYSNGMIATWNQEQTGSEEPPYPAPVLIINPEAPQTLDDTDPSPQPTATGTAELGVESTPAPSVVATSASVDAAQAGLPSALLTAIGTGMAVVATITAIVVRQRHGRNGRLRS